MQVIVSLYPQVVDGSEREGVDENQVDGSIEHQQPPKWQTEVEPITWSNLMGKVRKFIVHNNIGYTYGNSLIKCPGASFFPDCLL